MTNLTSTPSWDAVPQLETVTLAVGGPGGIMNAQAQALLNRVDYLKALGAASVADYGIKGDGTTDNSAAIVAMFAALDSGGTPYQVNFPKGDYLVSANIAASSLAALLFHRGARLVVPNGVTVTLNGAQLKAERQQVFRCTGTGKIVGYMANEVIYPEWWGAIADGLNPPVGADFSARAAAAARNSPALQAALNFAGYQYPINGNTGTVSLAYGFYVHDTTLTIPLSVNVIGYGIGSALFYYAATGNAIESINTNNSMLKDFFIAPIAGPTWNYTTGYGLYMKGVSTPVVDNVWSSSFGAGTFYFESVIEGRIRGCISDNSNGPAFVIRGVGQGTVLSGCVTAGTKGGACFDISGYDWHLMGCTGKDGSTGTNAYYLNACENINLTNCGCHSINKEGFLLTSSALNCTLTSCFVNDASMLTKGAYSAFSISGTRNKLLNSKATTSVGGGVQYNYALFFGGAATDCTAANNNFAPGTVGIVQDSSPIGANTYHVHKVSTTDATPTNIWSKWLNNSCASTIEVTVLAKQRGAAGESAAWKFIARAATGNGAPTLSAVTTIFANKSNGSSTINAALVLTDTTLNAGVVSVQVTGLGTGAAIDWEATVNVISVTG
jgi:hypothetical protein